ncbi:MAG: hypothetical protein CVV27_14470 [Candidatus Melainabacteria bacterium HGW-Melainabacteria-1]|nr:MAG: hypothetical protein CVV27_14470 [Candidatus Melainabacteria bacterium HGW-Melainabacteria-1]
MSINSLCRMHRQLFRQGGLPVAEKASRKPRQKPAEQEAWPTIFEGGTKKISACLDSAKRFVLAVGEYQTGSSHNSSEMGLAGMMRDEKKRLHKFAYSLIVSGRHVSTSPAGYVRSAFVAAGLSGKASIQEECEVEMIIAGTDLALRKAHPIIIMRTMTAFLGFSAFDAIEKWLAEHFDVRKGSDEELIIPGDLPDMLQERSRLRGSICQTMRLAGTQLVAATLAGCPRETIEYAKSITRSRLGAALLEWEIRDARNRLSSEELSDAQNAFMELLSSIRPDAGAGSGQGTADGPRDIDEGLVSDISNLILELDEHLLKSVVSNIDPKIVASLIQAMEPIAHDRLFSSMASSRSKKILDAIEASAPLSGNELTRRAQMFAQKVLSEFTPRKKPLGKTLPLPAAIRQILTSILSRE